MKEYSNLSPRENINGLPNKNLRRVGTLLMTLSLPLLTGSIWAGTTLSFNLSPDTIKTTLIAQATTLALGALALGAGTAMREMGRASLSPSTSSRALTSFQK